MNHEATDVPVFAKAVAAALLLFSGAGLVLWDLEHPDAPDSAIAAPAQSARPSAPAEGLRYDELCGEQPAFVLGAELGCALVRPAVTSSGKELGVAIVDPADCRLCEELGLQPGDIVTHVSASGDAGDHLGSTFTLEDWERRLRRAAPCCRVTLRVLREGRPAMLSRRIERGRFVTTPPLDQCRRLFEEGGRAAELALRAGCERAPQSN